VALSQLQRAIYLNPAVALWHAGLGLALAMTARLSEAIAAYRHALSLQPDLADVHFNLGHALQANRQPDLAIAAYRQAVSLRPSFAEALNNLGNVLLETGQLDAAIAAYRQALAQRPDHANACMGLGNALRDKGQLNDAVAAYERGAALRPDLPEAHYNLGHAFQSTGQRDRAMVAYRRAVSLRPDYPEALNNLGNLFQEEAELDEAIACYRAAAAAGRSVSAQNNLIYTLHFHPSYGMSDVAIEQGRWCEQYARPFIALRRIHDNNRDPDRRLRIGYVSPHFRNHPVGRFMLPLMVHHDHKAFEIVCYSDVAQEDEITGRLRGYADEWRPTSSLSDAQLAGQIRADRIDLLVDLTLHMQGSRLLAFAAAPAPVQVTYLAYCSTSGLDAMNYRLTDPHLDPPGTLAPHYSERSVYLPQTYWCYPPPDQVPPVNALPAATAGFVTFGCLNNYYKVTPPVWSAWYGILRSLPNARLVIFCPEGNHRLRITQRFIQAGLDPARLQMVGRSLPAEYFKQYQQIDIALDPFPHGGGTTTCDALWMGVPVVTLAGESAVSRGGNSILTNLGLPELIAHSPDEYVQIAAILAGDLQHLSELRATLRQKMLNSPLTDGPAFAHHVESAYRQMWRQFAGRNVSQ
jgi:predicted O-linked N-acetylglucosamine transferase (SPINDLY family)